MNKGMIGFCAALALLGWFLFTRAQEPKAPQGHFIMVLDTSPSMTDTLGCEAVVKFIGEQLDAPGFSIGKASRFALITTGGYSSSFEPRLVLDIPIPRATRNVVSRQARGRNREAFLKTIAATCAAQPRAEASAIFRAVQIALDYMKSRGCGGPDTNCRFSIASDGIENGDRAVRAYLFSDNPKASSPAALDNVIAQDTLWCGYAQIEGGNGPRSDGQRVLERWRALFKGPVAFQPYCAAEPPATQAER